jgi:hypothetical protein
MRLDHMTTVEEGHFAVGLHPHLVASVLRQNRQSCDVEAEFEGLGELAC